jgi:hypothetical protein
VRSRQPRRSASRSASRSPAPEGRFGQCSTPLVSLLTSHDVFTVAKSKKDKKKKDKGKERKPLFKGDGDVSVESNVTQQPAGKQDDVAYWNEERAKLGLKPLKS